MTSYLKNIWHIYSHKYIMVNMWVLTFLAQSKFLNIVNQDPLSKSNSQDYFCLGVLCVVELKLISKLPSFLHKNRDTSLWSKTASFQLSTTLCITKQTCWKVSMIYARGALSCIHKLLRIFFCITILSKSSILLTIPVTFIYSKSPLILNCDTIYWWFVEIYTA